MFFLRVLHAAVLGDAARLPVRATAASGSVGLYVEQMVHMSLLG